MKVPRSKMALGQKVLGSSPSNPYKYNKNILLWNHFAQILETLYVVLPSGTLRSLF